MSSLEHGDDDAVLLSVLEHVKALVREENGGVPIVRLQRQLARLPARTFGRFDSSVATIRLASYKYPGQIRIEPDGRVYVCADDKQAIFERVGVVSVIRPGHGIIKFGERYHECAFFNRQSMPRSLLPRGSKLVDAFSVGQKVCFEAQPFLQGNGPCKWYATAVRTLQRVSGTTVFNDADQVCGAASRTANEQRLKRPELPGTGVASQPTRSGFGDGAECATAKQRSSGAATQGLSFEAKPSAAAGSASSSYQVIPDPVFARSGLHSRAPLSRAASTDKTGVTHVSATGPAKLGPTYEAQGPGRLSQGPSRRVVRYQRSASLQEQPAASGEAAGEGAQAVGRVFNVEAARELAAVVDSTLMRMFREEVTLALSVELGLTDADLQMLIEETEQ